jgi:hypothetical protein
LQRDYLFPYIVTVKISHAVIDWLASRLKVPPIALRMFKAANAMSGLDRSTLPSELIPLNSIQLARGLLNFTVLQSLSDWVMPFWAERQYDPGSSSFIPRSHLGLSINVTHRNWTAVGNPECAVESIVDPRGLVMPFPNGWSIDSWLAVNEKSFYPSRATSVRQCLVAGLPLVETTFDVEGVRLRLVTWRERNQLFHTAVVSTSSFPEINVRLAFAVRPYNPEGISLVETIEYNREGREFVINGTRRLRLCQPPDFAVCSNREQGDSAAWLRTSQHAPGNLSASCPTGLANAFAAFDLVVPAGQERSVSCSCIVENGEEGSPALPDAGEAQRYWSGLLARGAHLTTPEPQIDSLYRASLCSLLMFTDGPSITPGPYTYHQFWFRDAAYMLWALDRLGFSSFVQPVIASFPARQESSGYFRSQLGEWDSNGQALWTVWQHTLLSRDSDLAASMFDSLWLGVRWIDRKRLLGAKHMNKPYFGLLPMGLSAEHLGLSDYYFWDDFWSIAGIRAFIRLCVMLGRTKERQFAESFLSTYKGHLEMAIKRVQDKYKIPEIPAGPIRSIDCGMIGSCSAWYPLQLYSPDDPRMKATLRSLNQRYVRNGMFFQQFIHSGMNPYLTLHLAQASLYGGDRKGFWDGLSTVAAVASTTLNFPEAIHPVTGGGSMGDGHHGWAAAEVVLAIRNAFVYELWQETDIPHDLVFLAGIPKEWCEEETHFSLRDIPVPEGQISIEVRCLGQSMDIAIEFQRQGGAPWGNWVLRLPVRARGLRINALEGRPFTVAGNETIFSIPAGAPSVSISIRLDR